MEPTRSISAILATLLLLSACAPRQPAISEQVPTPPPRYDQRGYSVVPLAESGWFVAQRTSEQIHFAKRGANVDESFTIHAALTNLPGPLTADELVQLMAAREKQDMQPGRFQVVKHDVTAQAYLDVKCARSYFLAKDNEPVRQSARTDSTEIEGAFFTCIHPRDPKLGVLVGYSQRRYPEHRDSAFSAKAEAVFVSLRFTDL